MRMRSKTSGAERFWSKTHQILYRPDAYPSVGGFHGGLVAKRAVLTGSWLRSSVARSSGKGEQWRLSRSPRIVEEQMRVIRSLALSRLTGAGIYPARLPRSFFSNSALCWRRERPPLIRTISLWFQRLGRRIRLSVKAGGVVPSSPRPTADLNHRGRRADGDFVIRCAETPACGALAAGNRRDDDAGMCAIVYEGTRTRPLPADLVFLCGPIQG